MTNSTRLIIAFLMLIIIFSFGNLIGRLSASYVGSAVRPAITQFTFLILSLILMYRLSSGNLTNYGFKPVQFRQLVKPFWIMVIAQIMVLVIGSIVMFKLGVIKPGESPHPVLKNMSLLQVFLVIFILASIAEEFLFRGLFQSFLEPLSEYKLGKLSLPVILSAISFGLAHFILLLTPANRGFVFFIVVNTMVLGFIASYFREKTESMITPIIVHMTANLVGGIIPLTFRTLLKA